MHKKTPDTVGSASKGAGAAAKEAAGKSSEKQAPHVFANLLSDSLPFSTANGQRRIPSGQRTHSQRLRQEDPQD